MEDKSLKNRLIDLYHSQEYPLHMPGHKRKIFEFPNPFSIDITEIEGFDNLHHPEGILKRSMESAAKIYGADKSYYLVNGSTAGILAAISATTRRRGKILMGRNSHKSAYHGVFLQELEALYTYPQYMPDFQCNGGLDIENIREMLKIHSDIQMVFITSPTYEGIVSDIQGIAAVVHSYGIPLTVDEAHGAHFTFGQKFPISALDLGADIVIQSLHKTLPALTQSAILHTKGKLVNSDKIEQYLQIYQTSSPSYVLMAAIEECIQWSDSTGREIMDHYYQVLSILRDGCKKLKHIKILDPKECGKYGIFDIDESKLFLSVKGKDITGPGLLERLLTEYGIQLEMSGISHVLAITSVADTSEGFERFGQALEEIDRSLKDMKIPQIQVGYQYPKSGLTIYEALTGDKAEVTLMESINHISAEFIYAYPPGIPIITPGEIINEKVLEKITEYLRAGISLQGTKDITMERLKIVLKK